MKKVIVFFMFFFLFSYSFAQSSFKINKENIIIAGTVNSILLIDESCYYLCKLKDISVIYGNYSEDTITIKINPCATTGWILDINKQVVLSAKLIKGTYEIYREYYDFSPFYSIVRLDSSDIESFAMNQYEVKSPHSFIRSYTNYFKRTRAFKVNNKEKAFLGYIYDKNESVRLRQFAIPDLKTLYTGNCLPRSYVKKIWYNLYNDTTLDIEIRRFVNFGGGSEESTFSLYNNDIAQKEYSLIYRDKGENHLKYAIPLWKKGVTFCDSMIDKYQSIIKNYSVVRDTISLQNENNLFFAGKIKKTSKNKLIIKNLKTLEGKYLEDEITVRTNIDTVFDKSIAGSKVLINTNLVNGKYILNISNKHKGFYKPPLTPDGNNLFILNTDNLLKNNINIKPNELIEKITNYYSGLNAEIKIKEKKLTNYIKKGEYLFIRTRSLWEFSDLSLQYDSLCWDYNKKHEFLNSIINSYRKYKHPPLPIIVTADMLFNKSFNENYSSKYKTNIYEMDRSSNLQAIQDYQQFLKSKDAFAHDYAVMRFQDMIEYYKTLKKKLQERIKKYDN